MVSKAKAAWLALALRGLCMAVMLGLCRSGCMVEWIPKACVNSFDLPPYMHVG